MKKAFRYVRISVNAQGQIASIVAPTNDIASHAKAIGVAVSQSFSDVGISPNLPERERMLKLVDAEEIDCILIADNSRLSRSDFEFAEIRGRCAKRGVEIITCR